MTEINIINAKNTNKIIILRIITRIKNITIYKFNKKY